MQRLGMGWPTRTVVPTQELQARLALEQSGDPQSGPDWVDVVEARVLRWAEVQRAYDAGTMNVLAAQEALRAPLEIGGRDWVYDDSADLLVRPEDFMA